MKRCIFTSKGLSAADKTNLRHVMNSIIFWMWNDGDKMHISGDGSTHAKTVEDYKNSDYSSLSKYVMDHKQDIFPRGDIMMDIDDYAKDHKNSYEIRQELLKIYDNYTEADFARNLYLRRDDPKAKKSSVVSSSKKILANSAIDFYKKIPIYRDDTSDDVYIYRRKHGEGRINFPTVEECKKFIDDNIDDIKCARNVVIRSGCHSKE